MVFYNFLTAIVHFIALKLTGYRLSLGLNSFVYPELIKVLLYPNINKSEFLKS